MIGRSFLLTLGFAIVGSCALAQAAEVEMKLVNQGSDGIMAFEPPVVKIKPGDSVKFVATDAGHMVASIPGLGPEGAKGFQGEFSKDYTVTFDKPGVYGIQCVPHYFMGMVGLVAVGNNYPNLAAAKATETNPEAKKRLDADFAELSK